MISVIIPTKDRPSDLRCFIGSLVIQRRAVNELIIVDASQKENNIKELCDGLLRGKGIAFKYVRTTPGNSYQRNVGISLLDDSSEYVCFFDDDIILFEDTIQNMMSAFEKHADIGALQGVEVNIKPENILGRIFKSIFFMGHQSKKWAILPSGECNTVLKPSADMPIGSFMVGYCIKRRILDEFKFDEWFTGYAFLEDYDFSFRIAKRFKIIQSPSVRFIHNRVSSNRPNVLDLSRMRIVNKHYFFKKNIEQDLPHLAAFYWSIIGHLKLNLAKSIFKLNPGYFIGTLQGVIAILRRNRWTAKTCRKN